MLKQQQQPGSGGRKASNGTSGPASMSPPVSGINSGNRTPAGRNRTSAKPSFQSSPVFEGVYNNARMLHFLTAVVGSTCDIRVKNGSVFEGVFKTLSSRCELAVDAVHKRSEEECSTSLLPRREDITDTMIFSPSDLVTMICKDVDLNYATRDTFTDTAISSTRVNGEHKEKVLQRWEGGDSNGESYDLENDAANGWDANEMFRFNEVKYGVTSTYDSSLSMYTVPLEKGTSDTFRQREARAARLASEIESSPQYRHRVGLENDEGKSEEDKYSAVVRDGNDRERGRESPRERERERGRDSPGASTREGKYIPLPQRQREMNRDRERVERGPGGPPPHNRLSGSYRSNPPSSSPRPPLASAAGPQSGISPSERNSPLSGRGGAYAPHHPQGSPSPGPNPGPASSYTPASQGGPAPTPVSAASSPASPPAPHGHAVPHSHSLPHTLADAGRPVNGVSSRTSPKAQRPPQSSRTVRTSNSHAQSTARSPKSGSSQDTPYLDTSSVSMPPHKTSGPAPLFPVDVNEILGAKERAAENLSSTEDGKNSKAPSVQQRSQIEELRKFGKEFRLQPSGGSSSSPSSPATATPPTVGDVAQSSAAQPSPSDTHPASEPKAQASAPGTFQHQPQPSPAPAEDATKDTTTTLGATSSSTAPISDRHSPATPQPARTPGSEEATEQTEAVPEQVKKSTLNPNAKEFNPNKPPMTMSKPNTAPTPPRPTPPSPVVLQHPGGQGPLYNAPYLSYVSQIHSVQPPPMYQYTMSAVSQGKYPRNKGSVVAQRSDHGSSAPPMLQAAASAAGAPLVASPYPQSYLQYNPQQYSQQQVIQAMTPYPGQPMYSMLQGGARMIGQGGGPHPQALGPPGGPQFSAQGDGSQGPQQGIYAQQSFSHHSGAVHHPQPSSTPTGNQPPPQHAAPSPGQNAQSGPQPQSLYHSGPLSAPTPPNMPPGHTSPQGSYPIQGYSIHSHQGIQQTYPLGQITQAHVQGAMSGPHHSGSHGQPQLVMLQPPPQQGPGSVPQHPQHGPQQGAHQHFYIGHPQAMQVQTHPAPFHQPGN
ncbi:ataxin-2-like protein isoform X2 [Cyclopterus lumpus]|uniref:LsmAD domain-containing protein n=1 Tax=Cyclopterus lumpus TaxID=8103 RepID=A0A8C2YXD2_CYCLU|nr:ataxin-2-like protein isoform X2 [Cyclopterus lumpus]XP_034415102.1 ataxin-2-like protein isoform X2 [Cyclopterus lumpus]